ncbi:DUF302 domain-containing protein [Mycolicibacterium iranicum]|uniref:DUF302 domain-containing protein n=1 Tax=Mycolicibacterium iranicum TaxID=912594 RepID=UPI0009EEAF59|nr:DUF302 domain-containing protein [Mycolicibacterium iranicum]
MGFAVSTTLRASFDDALARNVILGACSPPLARRAVEIDRQIGLLSRPSPTR